MSEKAVTMDGLVALYKDLAPTLYYVTHERCQEGTILYTPGDMQCGYDFVLLHPNDLITLRAELHGIRSLIRIDR